MSADLVNLRQIRKRRLREDKAKKADENRLTFGRTKAEKNLTRAINEKHHRALDEKRLEPSIRSIRQPDNEPGG